MTIDSNDKHFIERELVRLKEDIKNDLNRFRSHQKDLDSTRNSSVERMERVLNEKIAGINTKVEENFRRFEHLQHTLDAKQGRLDEKQDLAIAQVRNELNRKVTELDNARDFVNKIRWIGTGIVSVLFALGILELVSKINPYQYVLQQIYPPKTIVEKTTPEDLNDIKEDITTTKLASWIGNWQESHYESAFANETTGNHETFYNFMKDNVIDRWWTSLPPARIPDFQYTPKQIYMIGQIGNEVLIQPMASFGSEMTAECNRVASDDSPGAYIIISQRAHPDDFLWATCEHEIQIGLKKTANDSNFMVDNLDVVEIRRDGNLNDREVANVRLTKKAAEAINLNENQSLDGYVVVTSVKGYEPEVED